MGGSGFASYVVHFTEAEALGIIRARLEAEGLRFGAKPPSLYAPSRNAETKRPPNFGWGPRPEVGISLFDSHREVAVAYMDFTKSDKWYPESFDKTVKEEFAAQSKDITFGVFYAEFVRAGITGTYWEEDGDSKQRAVYNPTQKEIADAKKEARPELEKRLKEQLDGFVRALK